MSLLSDKGHRSLIIGGADVPKGRYPYYCSLDKQNGVIVSGALIARDIVLSAGHVQEDNMSHLKIKCGGIDPHVEDDPHVLTSHPLEWAFPTEYHGKDQFIYWDFLILKLAEPAKHESSIIRINDDPKIPKNASLVELMGVGWTDANVATPSSVLQSVTLKIVGNDDCKKIKDPLRPMIDYENDLDESNICTVSPDETPRDACAWDSGDPVIVPSKHNDPKKDLLVGLGSSGVGCADPIFPGLQARVSYGYEWIRTQVCILSDHPPQYFNCPKLHQYETGGAEVVIAPPPTTVTPVPTAAPTAPPTMVVTTDAPQTEEPAVITTDAAQTGEPVAETVPPTTTATKQPTTTVPVSVPAPVEPILLEHPLPALASLSGYEDKAFFSLASSGAAAVLFIAFFSFIAAFVIGRRRSYNRNSHEVLHFSREISSTIASSTKVDSQQPKYIYGSIDV